MVLLWGGFTAEDHSPEEYAKFVPFDDIVDEIYNALNEMNNDRETYGDEYDYYTCLLKNNKKCYVLTCNTSNSDDSVSVYWDKLDAFSNMIEELEMEIENLKSEGYEYKSTKCLNNAELYVPGNNIYYEWIISETTIK